MKRIIGMLVLFCAGGIFFIAKAQNEVKINTNFVVETDGTMRVDNAATVWDDLRVTLDNGSDAARLGSLTGLDGPQIWFCRNTGVDAMSFTVQLPHSYMEGTRIYPHLHWAPKTSTTGNVEWNLDYSWVNYNSVTPEVFPGITTSIVVATGPFTANTHLITSLTAGNAGIVGTGKKISSILICRIWRNSADTQDTYEADAGLLFLDFHYQLDTFGSREEYVK